MTITRAWNHPSYTDQEINEPLTRVLQENIMCAMATVAMPEDGTLPLSWINTMYYAYTEDLSLYILTYPTSEHVQNLERNPSIAVAIASPQEPHQYKVGVQIGGICEPVLPGELARATEVYTERFPWIADFVPSVADWKTTTLVSRLYKITPRRMRVFSERQVGTEMWLDLVVK